MAGLETVYVTDTVQGPGWVLNNTTNSAHQYTSGEYGDSNAVKKFSSEYGDYYSGHTLPKITAQQRNVNAWYIKRSMQAKGFSLNAICGMCGNMKREGGINPGVYQGNRLHDYKAIRYGVGIVQWTPYTKYTNWAHENGDLHIYDIESQCKRIQYECEHNIQYGHGGGTPMPSKYGTNVPTFQQFKVSTLTPYQLGINFWWHYEKPRSMTDESAKARGNDATYFYELFTGSEPPEPPPGPHDIPIWLLFKMRGMI